MDRWPDRPSRAPDALVTRLTPHAVELRAGNVLPVGLPSLFFVVFILPFFGLVASRGLALEVVHHFERGALGYALLYAVLLAVALGMLVLGIAFSVRADFQGTAADGLVVLDRRDRTVHQRVHPRVSEGSWKWDELVPYMETRRSRSGTFQALTLVDFHVVEGAPARKPSFVTLQIVFATREPLRDTYAFLDAFMERGIAELPRFRLTANPDPAWYTGMPPWFLGLPRPIAKSVWAFAFLVFAWPVVVWCRALRWLLPWSHWPADVEARLAVDPNETTTARLEWLAVLTTPPERVPVLARVAFVAAVLVSAPTWWQLATGYVAMVVRQMR